MGIKQVRGFARAFVITAATAAITSLALADGTETLGDPVGLTVADGTGYVAAGVGLSLGQPANIQITVPPAATVKQVILYWEGVEPTPVSVPATDTIKVDGVDVTGSFIGGGIHTINPLNQNLTYRADITSLNKVNPGPNSVPISGLDFDQNNGAGILAVIDEGAGLATLLLRDGNDFAFITAPSPMDTTVPQLFTFGGAGVARTATLTMFFADVEGQASGGGPVRPTTINIWLGNDLGGSPTMTVDNALASLDGEEWDTLIIPVNVPAGETMIQVQALSAGDGGLPASFAWITAGLQVPPPPRGGQGCTPGYWKQPHHFASWTAPYEPDMLFRDVFENAFGDMTLLEVLSQGGGTLIALGRHTVAALLNGASGGVDYDLTAAQVIAEFNGVYPGSNREYNTLKGYLEVFNEQGCPLGNADNVEAGASKGKKALSDVEASVEKTTTIASVTQKAASSAASGGGGGSTGPGLLLLLSIAAGLRGRILSKRHS